MNDTVLNVMSLEDAAASLPALVERVHSKREAMVITRSGQPVVRVVPLPAPVDASEGIAAFLRRWRTEHPDPDEQFADAIAEVRRTMQPSSDPWE